MSLEALVYCVFDPVLGPRLVTQWPMDAVSDSAPLGTCANAGATPVLSDGDSRRPAAAESRLLTEQSIPFEVRLLVVEAVSSPKLFVLSLPLFESPC